MIILPLLLVQCKKLDLRNTPNLQQSETDSLSPVLQKFFDTSKVSNSMITGIAKKIYRQDRKKPFIEKFVKYAGYPVWEKSMVIKVGSSVSIATKDGSDASGTVVMIPFSLRNDSTVNAILKVALTRRDTSFKMLYRWQYKRNGYEERDSLNNANKTALFFMGMESHVFGHKTFLLNDSLLLKGMRSSDTIQIKSFGIGQSNEKMKAVGIPVCVVYDCIVGTWVRSQSTEIVPGVCQSCSTYWTWVDDGTGGDGHQDGGTGDTPPTGPGTSGGAPDDGGWSDNPCNGSGGGGSNPVTRQQDPCNDPPAWEPVEDPPILPDDELRDPHGYLYSRIAELQTILHDFPQALLPCDSLNIMPLEQYGSMWQNVAQFKPSQYVMNRIDSIRNVAPNWIVDNFNIQSLKDASGGIVNCDFFPVRITQMPAGFTPESLLEYFRTRINSFIAPDLGMSFGPYWDFGAGSGLFIDTAKYFAPYEASVGSLWHLNLGSLPGADGSVIESGYTRYNSGGYQTNYFTVSTMETPLDFEHPVAGNRRFGIYSDPDHPGEFVFYTMGVDRAWDLIFDKGNILFKGFKSADSLWTSLQNGMIQFIQDNSGSATFYSKHNTIARPKWSDVEEYLMGHFDFIELKRRLGC